MTNILEKIIADKKINIEKYKKAFTIEDLKKKIYSYKNYLNFKDKLKKRVHLHELSLKIMSPK